MIQQKDNYEKNLVGKRFLYLYVDKDNVIKCKQMMFKREHYLHLTGMDYKSIQSKKRSDNTKEYQTHSYEFYKRLGVDEKIIGDISFIQEDTPEKTSRTFKYTQHKLENLSSLTSVSLKAEKIGKYNGERNFDIIVNKHFSSIAFIPNGNIYIPISSLYATADVIIDKPKDVLAIFSKEKEAHQFTIQYLNKNISLKNVKLDVELVRELNLGSFENKKVSFNINQLNELISIYKSSVKYDLTNQLNQLSLKREKVFNSESDMTGYINTFRKLIRNINEEHKKEITIEILSKQAESNSDSLIKDEIAQINKKFSFETPSGGLSAPGGNVTNMTLLSFDFDNVRINGGRAGVISNVNPTLIDIARQYKTNFEKYKAAYECCIKVINFTNAILNKNPKLKALFSNAKKEYSEIQNKTKALLPIKDDNKKVGKPER